MERQTANSREKEPLGIPTSPHSKSETAIRPHPVQQRVPLGQTVQAHTSSVTTRRQHGFSLIELMTTLAVVATIYSLSGSLADFTLNTQSTSIINNFVTAIHYARSEAISRNAVVTLCRSKHGTQCDSFPDIHKQKDWSNGWMIYLDTDENRRFNRSRDEILRFYHAIPESFTLTSQAKVRITYTGSGFSKGFMDTWKLCHKSADPTFTRGLVLNFIGRIRMAKDSDGNGVLDNSAPEEQFKEIICHPTAA